MLSRRLAGRRYSALTIAVVLELVVVGGMLILYWPTLITIGEHLEAVKTDSIEDYTFVSGNATTAIFISRGGERVYVQVGDHWQIGGHVYHLKSISPPNEVILEEIR